MEMSEDYTCVISHRPNPKTTHIYRDCLLESYRNVVLAEFSVSPEPYEFGEKQSFLSFCYGCNKSLKENDVYVQGRESILQLRVQIQVGNHGREIGEIKEVMMNE